MTLNIATLIQRITRREATSGKSDAARGPADPFDRLARIVRVERAREAAVMRMQVQRSAN